MLTPGSIGASRRKPVNARVAQRTRPIFSRSASQTIRELGSHDATVATFLQRAAGADVPFDFLAICLDRGVAGLPTFGHGRVRLAGDAVHLFTPTGGFGMNTGMRRCRESRLEAGGYGARMGWCQPDRTG